MAKKPKDLSPSLLDLDEENLLDLTSPDDEEEELEEEVDEEEEEEEEPKPTPVKKKEVKKEPPVKQTKKKEEPIEEPEEEDLEDEEQPEEEEEETEPESNFWEEVSKITGTELEVEYGDIDPVSPQGAALREKAVAEKAINDFVARLEDEYPSVYQALQYAHAGGDVRELYQGDKDYSKIVVNDDDEDHAKVLLAEYYSRKGFNDVRAKRMIAADAESEEGLVGTAKAALAEMVQEQAEDRQAKLQAQQAAAQAQRQQDQKFLKSVNDLLAAGRLDSFSIPKQETGQFLDFLKGSLQRDEDGGYLIVTKVDPSQLEKQLQAEYFKFKKGDLSKLVQVKATTVATEKLRLRVAAPEKQAKSTTKPASNYGSLKDLDV